MNPDVGRTLVTSRLLILQSKRLMLSSLERRIADHGDDRLTDRVRHFRGETERAQHAYRHVVLHWGSAESRDYWPIVYGKLIEVATGVAWKMRVAFEDLPPPERYQVSTDVEALEGMVAGWRRSGRDAISVANA